MMIQGKGLVSFTDKMRVCRYADIDFIHYGWGALMQNQFKGHPTAAINGEPVLEYYYLAGEQFWEPYNINRVRKMRGFSMCC